MIDDLTTSLKIMIEITKIYTQLMKRNEAVLRAKDPVFDDAMAGIEHLLSQVPL